MPSSTAERILTKGFRSDRFPTASGPSTYAGANPSYYDVLGYWLQPYLGMYACSALFPASGANQYVLNGIANYAGTRSTPAIASTNILTQCRRTTLTTIAATNTSGGLYSTLPFFFSSGSTGIGGFVHCYRVAFSTSVVGNRAFIGVTNVQNPIASANLGDSGYYYGFGFDTGDAVASGFYFTCNNNGTRTKTQISTMSRTTSTLHDIWIWCKPGEATIYSWVWDLTNDAERQAVTAVSTNIPVDQPLYSCIVLNTGTSGAAIVNNIVRWECFCPW
jgi:hypothetical protein